MMCISWTDEIRKTHESMMRGQVMRVEARRAQAAYEREVAIMQANRANGAINDAIARGDTRAYLEEMQRLARKAS